MLRTCTRKFWWRLNFQVGPSAENSLVVSLDREGVKIRNKSIVFLLLHYGSFVHQQSVFFLYVLDYCRFYWLLGYFIRLVIYDLQVFYSWFQIFAVFWMLYAFFWVISRHMNFICRRFGTLFHLHRRIGIRVWRWNRVPKRQHIKLPRRKHTTVFFTYVTFSKFIYVCLCVICIFRCTG